MQLHAEHIIGRLCMAGINHTKASAEVRGIFSVDKPSNALILAQARQMGIQSVFVISTCNRTEIYGYAQHPHELGALLTMHTKGTMAELVLQGYFFQGKDALQHLFRVACGLDSQIVGDYEIQGQLKQAFTAALDAGMIGPIMDRTINFVFQASKKIRSSTALSSGTVSVSFAAIEWLQKNVDKTPKKILLLGTGKFGRNVCKNIRHYLPQCSLTITNRTSAASEILASDIGAVFIPFDALPKAVNEFDIILVCTNAMEPVIKVSHFEKTGTQRVIIDLSVPANVEAGVAGIEGVQLINVDKISAIAQGTIARRLLEVPKAEAIIEEYEYQFAAWLQTHQHAPAIRHIKENLRQLSTLQTGCEMADTLHREVMQELNAINAQDAHISKTVSNLVVNLKTKKEKGCQFIAAYHHFLSEDEKALHNNA